MKVNVFKVLGVINMFMELAQGFKERKTGPEKLEYVVEHSTEVLAGVEGLAERDLLKDERVRPFVDKYIAAGKDLVNIVNEVKALKADPS